LLDDAKSKGDWLVALLPTVNAAQYPLNRIHCRPFLLAAPLLAAPLAQDGHRLGLRKHFAGSLPDRPEVGRARRRQRPTPSPMRNTKPSSQTASAIIAIHHSRWSANPAPARIRTIKSASNSM